MVLCGALVKTHRSHEFTTFVRFGFNGSVQVIQGYILYRVLGFAVVTTEVYDIVIGSHGPLTQMEFSHA